MRGAGNWCGDARVLHTSLNAGAARAGGSRGLCLAAPRLPAPGSHTMASPDPTPADATTADDGHQDAKWAAYRCTVLELPGERPLRVDLRRPLPAGLGARFEAAGVAPPVAILTAENPGGENSEDAPTERQEARAEERNAHRMATLLEELRAAGLPHARVDGVSPDGDYREHCVAVPLGREEGRALARRLRQLAFFWFDGREIWLEPGLADRAPERLARANGAA